ncbi:hypothetical protein ACFYO5_11850 [Streptomyces sp. NPDC006259]|uniref:hypothetical protein n=1 Tax=Streptomyces sp. NPDC006259 TaxID=3364740 RepID=UPI0036CF3955
MNMRKVSTAFAGLALAAVGLVVPTTSAQAAGQGAGCEAKWPGRDGYVRAWQHPDCQGILLGASTGDDSHWGDGAGGFGYDAYYDTSSVMNSGTLGGRDVVAFYHSPGYIGGYTCLSPYELYADNLTDNHFTDGLVVDNRIGSHRWVTSAECAPGSWLS